MKNTHHEEDEVMHNKRNSEVRHMLDRIPKLTLGFFPTPLHRLDHLSKILGVEIYLKRDDLSGFSVFGGNKIRKLEYLLADALEQKSDTVITYGASQSNHAMQTVTSCRRLGLNPLLYLVSMVKSDEEELKANLLLERILGAEVHLEPLAHSDDQGAAARCKEKAQMRIRELEETGHKCYEIPMGGANALGTLGFIEGFLELEEQVHNLGVEPEYLYHASGSGGTLAGLAAGKKLLQSGINIRSVGVGLGSDDYKEKVAALATDVLSLLGSEDVVTQNEFEYHDGYSSEGYEVPSEAGTEALLLLARHEGILLDPVYTAKAFSGMVDHIRKGDIAKGSTVVFWHTGGVTALFAEKEILGEIPEEMR